VALSLCLGGELISPGDELTLPSLPWDQINMVQLDCGPVRTDGLPPPPPRSTEERDGTEESGWEGRVCVGGKGLCRKEGFRAVDGTEGSLLDRRACVLSDGRVRAVDGTEGSAFGGKKGLRLEEGRVQAPGKRLWRTGAGRAGGSGLTSRPLNGARGPRPESSPQRRPHVVVAQFSTRPPTSPFFL
jgi:hypothetical protein